MSPVSASAWLAAHERVLSACTHLNIISKITSSILLVSELPKVFISGVMRAILTFHSIDDSGSVLSYPPRTFERLLLALQHSGIPLLDLDTLLRAETKTGVALTFDDECVAYLPRPYPFCAVMGHQRTCF